MSDLETLARLRKLAGQLPVADVEHFPTLLTPWFVTIDGIAAIFDNAAAAERLLRDAIDFPDSIYRQRGRILREVAE